MSDLEERIRRGGVGLQIRVQPTRKGGLQDQLREIPPGVERILVVGGDGTLSEVLEAVWKLGVRVPIGIVPVGTGNDMARSLGLFDGAQWDVDRVIAYLRAGNTRHVDLWSLDTDKVFSNYASLGLDAAVVRGFCRIRDRIGKSPFLGRRLSYFVLYFGVWLTEAGHRIPHGTTLWWVDKDGNRFHLSVGGARVLSFSNTPYYAAGSLMDPGASVGDGLLEVTLFSNMAPYTELIATRFRPFSRFGLQGRWWRVRAKSVEVIIPTPTPIQADGEDVTDSVGYNGLLKVQNVGQVELMVW